MKKPRKTQPPKPASRKPSKPRRSKKTGGASEGKSLARLTKNVGFVAMGDDAAKAMILMRYLNGSKLFERHLNEQFDRNRTIQKKLKIDFGNDLMAYVAWVNGPGNQVPVHSNARLPKKGNQGLKQHVGFQAVGETAAKAIILGYYYPYAHLFHEVISRQFEEESIIQRNLQEVHKNDLYAYLGSLYSYK